MSEPLPEKTDLNKEPPPGPNPASSNVTPPENEPPVPLSSSQIPESKRQPTVSVQEPADTTTTTLLNAFTRMASGAESSSWDVLECGNDRWSYHQLDVISTGLAIELHEAYGSQPTVAFLSENHPYMLALVLATWKLGGIIAPYDPHAPEALLEGMMQKVSPACLITPSTNTAGRKIAQGT
jgi:non-ribosomal peptide synthetase component F